MPAKNTSKKPTRSPKAKKSTSPKKQSMKAGDQEVTIDRRKEEELSVEVEAPTPERREKVQRRRQIDPTTCERDYTDDEVEFMNAMDEYKRQSGRMFPTCSEVLEVIRGLGYFRLSPAELALQNENTTEAGEALGAEASSEEDEFASNVESEELAASGWAI